jgi:hypothetical protein
MKITLIAAMFCLAALGRIAAAGPAESIFASPGWTTPESQIDKLVFTKLAKLDSQPAGCSDAVFVRRVFLDTIGTLPSAKEAKDFIRDQDPNKRRALIDRLLERDEFADYWAMKWSDLLRVKAEFPINLWPNAAQAYHRWIRASIRDNKPYDRFVRDLLTANGSNFRVGPVNFYRAMQDRTPEGIAGTVALTFMGARAESWPKSNRQDLAAFFTQISYKPTREWKEEIVFWDPDKDVVAQLAGGMSKPASNAAAPAEQSHRSGPPAAVFPDGTKLKQLPPDRDPREVFADWLITPGNAWFTANIVNRVWFWLLGRGIIHEPDDIRPDNPPANPELLAYLRQELVANKYDLKHIYRLILNSRTYQLAAGNPKPDDSRGEADFACYPLRRLDAEVLIDAINKVTGMTDLYTSAIPEPFTYIPERQAAIALPDGSITSPFLELFGRPARATGMDNERNNRPLPTQRMYLLNSSHIQRKIEDSPKLKAIMGAHLKRQEITENLYLAILSRFPTEDELQRAEKYAKSSVVRGREAWIDLVWALLNSDEFLYRH